MNPKHHFDFEFYNNMKIIKIIFHKTNADHLKKIFLVICTRQEKISRFYVGRDGINYLGGGGGGGKLDAQPRRSKGTN